MKTPDLVGTTLLMASAVLAFVAGVWLTEAATGQEHRGRVMGNEASSVTGPPPLVTLRGAPDAKDLPDDPRPAEQMSEPTASDDRWSSWTHLDRQLEEIRRPLADFCARRSLVYFIVHDLHNRYGNLDVATLVEIVQLITLATNDLSALRTRSPRALIAAYEEWKGRSAERIANARSLGRVGRREDATEVLWSVARSHETRALLKAARGFLGEAWRPEFERGLLYHLGLPH